MEIPRISPREARQKVQRGEALLVCAYDSMEKFGQFHLEGALSLEAFRSRLSQLPREREIVFYCAWPEEATSARVAETYRQQGYGGAVALAGGVNAWKEAGFTLVE